MNRSLVALLVSLLLLSGSARAATSTYTTALGGHVVGYRLSGLEPDGDPIDQVILSTTLAPTGTVPRLHLVISSYLENFKPDTTPVLPDLLYPKQTAQNLGGFLEGKALITDDAGTVYYVGAFLAEAFFDNSNHAVFSLDGRGAAKGSFIALKGIFTLHKDASLAGKLTGRVNIPSVALGQIRQNAGRRFPAVSSIISQVTVHPAPMMGRSTAGNSHVVLHTGYGPTPAAPSHSPLSPVTIIAAIGVVVSLAWAGLLFWNDRRRKRPPATEAG